MVERTNREWLMDLRGPRQREALAELRRLLVRGLRYGLGHRADVTETDLDDFVQEALLKILDRLDSFRRENRFTTWAHKIAIHQAFTELRRRHWRDVSIQDLEARYREDSTPPALTDPSPSPEQQVTQRMLMDLIRRLIAEELTERQRRAMMAVMLGGMPLEEVARRMGTNRNALYKLLHDARQRLKKRLLGSGISPQQVMATFETESRG